MNTTVGNSAESPVVMSGPAARHEARSKYAGYGSGMSDMMMMRGTAAAGERHACDRQSQARLLQLLGEAEP